MDVYMMQRSMMGGMPSYGYGRMMGAMNYMGYGVNAYGGYGGYGSYGGVNGCMAMSPYSGMMAGGMAGGMYGASAMGGMGYGMNPMLMSRSPYMM
ncbi:hypothetical protein EMMF5_001721 [Cystobasidiomycetes sp. EMM_F5]